MTKFSNDNTPPTSDHLRLIRNDVGIDAISEKLESVLAELSESGANDAALLEVLMKSVTGIALCSTDDPGVDVLGRHAMGRYNQLSRLSGELEGVKAILMRDWCDRQSEPQA